MLQSQLFTKTRREAPTDEVSKNAELLIRAGYINKELAGVYSYLPLGLRVLNKIEQIVREEMEKLGSQEIFMSTLQDKELWQKTDRWSDKNVDIWFKSKLQSGNEVGFGWSHEEPIANMMRSHIESYQDLPVFVHQFQNKLRNEVRAKSGILRCREFIMKDMYSFCDNEQDHLAFYDKATQAYHKVFDRVGLGDITYVTSASGGLFTDKFSHEFQTICDAGEDNIYVHKKEPVAINEEIFTDETISKLGLSKSDFELKKAAEVGNIFTFGTKKCQELGLTFANKNGEKIPVYLGSYGIGISRLMGVLVEVMADDKGLVWPKEVAPFTLHLLEVGGGKLEVRKNSQDIYDQLTEEGIEVLYDDRDLSAGEKFADADLIGLPYRVVVSAKTVAAGKIELKERTSEETKLVTIAELTKILKTYRN